MSEQQIFISIKTIKQHSNSKTISNYTVILSHQNYNIHQNIEFRYFKTVKL